MNRFSKKDVILISAKQYELKFTKSQSDIENDNQWDSLPSITEQDLLEGTLEPVEGGTKVDLKLNPILFESDTDYFMAMKASDERNSKSIRSNTATFARLIPPSKVEDLIVLVTNNGDQVEMSFTSPGDDEEEGTGESARGVNVNSYCPCNIQILK